MISLWIDAIEVHVDESATVLEAAAQAGIRIPTLCFHPGHDPLTSCMVCLVKVDGSPRLLPACATRVRPGMRVESQTEEVTRARRAAIELLLSDHGGECLPPCQLVCPAHMEIETMLRQIAAGDFHAALVTVKRQIPLPATLGRICPELCENGCRRKERDAAVSICRLKRFVADLDLAGPAPYRPPLAPPTGKIVSIIGAGPAGLSAAYFLALAGHHVRLFDARPAPGGALRDAIDPARLPAALLDREIALILSLGVEFHGDTPIAASASPPQDLVHPTLDQLLAASDALLVACGSQAAARLGLPLAGKGLQIDRDTTATPRPGVFAAGGAVVPLHHAIRAVADGHAAADAINAFVNNSPLPHRRLPWSTRYGILSDAEKSLLLALGDPAARPGQLPCDLSPEQARQEARRCLRCGCSKVNTCQLRVQAVSLGAEPTRYKGARRPLVPALRAPHPQGVLFDVNKCISCGHCVQITRHSPHGFAQINRGFSAEVALPLGISLADALGSDPATFVNQCPTGALRWDEPHAPA